MTLLRTIRRREKRKRAKADAARIAAEWARKSPEERAFIENINGMLRDAWALEAERLNTFLTDKRFMSDDTWPEGNTIRVRLPERFRTTP